MYNISEDSLLIGTSELRTAMPELEKVLKKKEKKIILTKRGKPIGILADYEDYERKEEFLDEFEDYVLGHIAKERWENSKESDYLPMEELAKTLKIKL